MQNSSEDAIDVLEVADLIASLVEKSLVHTDGDRFWMLETVRAYGRAGLAQRMESEPVRSKHFAFCLSLAELASSQLNGPEVQRWLDLLEAEHDNLRSALEWSSERDHANGLRLAGALGRFWEFRGHVGEGRRILSGLLSAESANPPSSAAPGVRAKALSFAGILASRDGDYAAAQTFHEEGLAIRRSIDDRTGVGSSLNNLGIVIVEQGNFRAAKALYEESLAIWRELRDERGLAATLNNLGFIARVTGDYPTAQELQEESLAIHRSWGDRNGTARLLNNLGNVLHAQGDYDQARELHRESLEIRREIGDRWGVALTLCNLGNVEFELGNYDAARHLYQDGLAIHREREDRAGISQALTDIGILSCATGDYADARSRLEESLRIRMKLGDRWGIESTLTAYASAVAVLEDPIRAARLWGAAERLRNEIGARMQPREQERYLRQVSAARSACGDKAAFDGAWRQGHAQTAEQALASRP